MSTEEENPNFNIRWRDVRYGTRQNNRIWLFLDELYKDFAFIVKNLDPKLFLGNISVVSLAAMTVKIDLIPTTGSPVTCTSCTDGGWDANIFGFWNDEEFGGIGTADNDKKWSHRFSFLLRVISNIAVSFAAVVLVYVSTSWCCWRQSLAAAATACTFFSLFYLFIYLFLLRTLPILCCSMWTFPSNLFGNLPNNFFPFFFSLAFGLFFLSFFCRGGKTKD